MDSWQERNYPHAEKAIRIQLIQVKTLRSHPSCMLASHSKQIPVVLMYGLQNEISHL